MPAKSFSKLETAVNNLVSFWNTNFYKETYIHKDDYSLIKNMLFDDCKSFSEYKDKYLNKFENPESNEIFKFHPSLYPVPYCGDLRNAKIFILSLNPGFDCDYYHEDDEKFKSALKSNLAQKFDTEYQLCYLNPEFCWTGSGRYWLKKFSSLIQYMLKNKMTESYTEALKLLSQNIALLEIVPYHSKSFHFSKYESLASVQVMINFINEIIADKSKKLIILRKGNELIETKKLITVTSEDEKSHVCVYRHSECQSASLSENSKGGEIIINFLKSKMNV